jgi:demethylmenaquinone methyltransferase/2-methoxy-6-polyprenyl-1,4-benzoquinol methylase
MPVKSHKKTTHFGYREVPMGEKANLVASVFRSVAPKYDLMNDLMTFGMHRIWKRFTLSEADLRPGQSVLDVASGTGDLALALAKMVGKHGKVIMTDINEAMLNLGRDRLTDEGMLGNIECIQADAEHLPFADNHFDCITIAFGLRNVTNKTAALSSLYLVLKPGGKLLIL